MVSGPNSITNITISFPKKGETDANGNPAVFGREQLGAVMTDFPLEDDAEFRKELETSGSIEVAVSKAAAAYAKSARASVNSTASPTTVAGGETAKTRIGVQILNIHTESN